MDKQADGNGSEAAGGITDDAVRGQLRSFAGHLAHDFNNLLTPLLAYPQLIREDLPTGGTGRDLLDVMEEIAETMANIVHRLGDFALSRRHAKHPVAIDVLVREALTEVEHDNLAVGIAIKSVQDSGLDMAVPHDVLHGPLKAICTNALEVMDGRGTLSVTVDSLSVDDASPWVQGNRVPAGQYARISVHDTGPGMTPEVREHAFDLFFTAGRKSKARGSGLGLSIALATVRDYGGFILLGDQADAGFTVSLLLPGAGDPLADGVAVTEVAAENQEPNLKERVLVVDDEESIVDLFKLILESVIPGIEVDTARNGREAVNAFKAGHHAVIVMDLNMPIMDGQSAFRSLSELCESSGLRMPSVVFCTGYAPTDGITQTISGNTHHDLLHKPVTSERLVRAVQERLSPPRQ